MDPADSDVDLCLQVAYDESHAGDLRAALIAAARGLAVAHQRGDQPAALRCRAQLALIHNYLGNFSRSTEYAHRALSRASESQDHNAEALCQYVLAENYRHVARFNDAIEHADAAASLVENVSDLKLRVLCLSTAVHIYVSLADFSEAFVHKTRLARRHADLLGEILTGRPTDSAPLGYLLSGYCFAVGGTLLLAYGLLHHAFLDYREALAIARHTRDRLAETDRLVALGAVCNRLGDFRQGIDYGDEALRLSRSIGAKYAHGLSLGVLGVAYAGVGDLRSAIDHLEQSANMLHAIGAIDDQSEISAYLGYAYSDTNEPEMAYAALKSSIALSETVRGPVLHPWYRSNLLEKALPAYRALIRTCLRPRLGRHSEAFEYAQRVKSVRLSAPPALRNLYRMTLRLDDHFRSQEHLNAEFLNKRQGRTDPFQSWWDRPRLRSKTRSSDSSEEDTSLASLVSDLKRHAADRLTSPPIAPLTYDDMRAALPDDATAMVDFFFLENHIVAFVILKSATSPAVILPDLTPAGVTELATRWFQTYAAIERDAPAGDWRRWLDTLDSILGTLYKDLLEPLVTFLDLKRIRKLILIPHHWLHLLPLHAAWVDHHSEKQYLIDMYDEISYAPSSDSLKQCSSRRHRGVHQVMVVCNDDQQREYGLPLRHALREEEHILKLYPNAKVRHGEKAVSDALLREARNVDILHLICHAFHDARYPLESYLGLFRSRLTLREILERLELSAGALVVLSACETGLSDVSNTDECVGLATGFLSVGASSVVSSLWVVDDESAGLLMQQFYRNLLTGLNRAGALNDAQRWLKTLPARPSSTYAETRFLPLSGPVAADYSHPFYWAPFYLLGAS